MALRLGSIVLCGEIINLQRNSVHGWLGLKDQEMPLRLSLTGNCQGDLAGKHFRFEVREESLAQQAAGEEQDLSRLAWEQVGPTGDMTIRPVRVFECSTDEFLRRSKLGEPPPTQWKDSLYLEWYSQNGRVVLELVDPQLEFVDPNAADEDVTPSDAGKATVEFDPGLLAAGREEGPGEALPWDDELDGPDADDSDDENEDPYGLFPEELEAQFEEDAFATDREVLPDALAEFNEQVELYDEVVSGEGVPIREIFDPPMKVYCVDNLDDAQVAVEFHALLGRLALHGIALDMCEHYTPRRAYKLLVETILVEERTYPRLASTTFVQHYMTHEYCPECDAEMEAKYEAYEKERKQRQEGESAEGDDSVPF